MDKKPNQANNQQPKNQQFNQHNNQQPTKPKQADTSVVANTGTRRGEAIRASRRNSELVRARATQHIVDVPVNKSIYNGRGGAQFTTTDLRRANQLSISKEKTLRVIPLGGLGEISIGKNMAAIEYGDEIVVIDMGILFPGVDYPGINYFLPNTAYLEERKHKIKAHIFTHGHLDHIGGSKHILRKLPAPVYGSKFTLAMVQRQMEEDPTGYSPTYITLNPESHERVQLGNSFSLELLRVNHSIPDSTAVILRTPVGVLIHTGDWRFEENPIDGLKFDIPRLEEIVAKERVLLLMSDSTNCENLGSHPYGEPEIAESFDDVMKRSKGRIIFSAFSSQIHRIQSVLEQAHKHGRKVAFSGYSMIQNLEVALRAGAIKVPKDTIVRIDDIIKLPDDQVVIVGTGSQGEINAVLARMSTGAHRQIKVKPNDTIIFSSNPIPGNETNVTRTVDGLMREGSKVFENRTREFDHCGPLHLSGHGYYDDHVRLLNIVKPKFYMPIHGEFHMLVRSAELAVRETSIPKDNVFVMDSGDVLELTANKAEKTGRIKVGSVMVDQAGAEISEVVLKDRIHMSTDGIFTALLTINKKTGQLLTSPDIISRGFIYLRDSEELMAKIRRYLKQKIAKAYSSGHVDIDDLKKAIKDDVAHILFDETQRTPIVIPVINEIDMNFRPAAPIQPEVTRNDP